MPQEKLIEEEDSKIEENNYKTLTNCPYCEGKLIKKVKGRRSMKQFRFITAKTATKKSPH